MAGSIEDEIEGVEEEVGEEILEALGIPIPPECPKSYKDYKSSKTYFSEACFL